MSFSLIMKKLVRGTAVLIAGVCPAVGSRRSKVEIGGFEQITAQNGEMAVHCRKHRLHSNPNSGSVQRASLHGKLSTIYRDEGEDSPPKWRPLAVHSTLRSN
jgi:hypothetical protein